MVCLHFIDSHGVADADCKEMKELAAEELEKK